MHGFGAGAVCLADTAPPDCVHACAPAGTILVDDVDIRTMEPATLRRQIGCVEQEPRIFPGTALENLCFGFDPT